MNSYFVTLWLPFESTTHTEQLLPEESSFCPTGKSDLLDFIVIDTQKWAHWVEEVFHYEVWGRNSHVYADQRQWDFDESLRVKVVCLKGN